MKTESGDAANSYCREALDAFREAVATPAHERGFVIAAFANHECPICDGGERVAGRPEVQCAFALGRGRYCRLPGGHEGDHKPSTRHIAPTTGEAVL